MSQVNAIATPSSTMTMEQMQAQLMKLMSERDALQAALVRKEKNTGSLIKVSAKGAVSVYGFGKWPITLYKSQWLKLFPMAEQITAFISENDALLAVKEE